MISNKQNFPEKSGQAMQFVKAGMIPIVTLSTSQNNVIILIKFIIQRFFNLMNQLIIENEVIIN
jgi:hypothetical protein